MYLLGGDNVRIIQTGGNVSANASATNSTGINISSNGTYGTASYIHSGGDVTANASGVNSTGIYIASSGDSSTSSYNYSGGKVTVNASGISSTGIRIYSNSDNSTASYNHSGGDVTASATGFVSTGISITSNGDNSAASYNHSGGKVSVSTSSEYSNGINLLSTGDYSNATYRHSGGDVMASANAEYSNGIHIQAIGVNSNATYSQSGGNVTAYTLARNSNGIFIDANGVNSTASYHQSDGKVMARASGFNRSGISIQSNGNNSTASYIQDGGTVIAEGYNDSSSNGIAITNNSFSAGDNRATYALNGGSLILMPDAISKTGISVRVTSLAGNASASFAAGSVTTPVIDAATDTVGKIQISTNSADATASATIADGAILRPQLTGTSTLAKGQTTGELVFLETVGIGGGTNEGISGAFTLDETLNTLTFQYIYTPGPYHHTIRATRVGVVSDFANKGANRNLARALEANSAYLATAEGQPYSDYYSELDASRTQGELNKKLRAANNANATRLTHQTLMNIDRAQNTLFAGMRATGTAASGGMALHEPIVLASSDPAYTLGRGGRQNGSNAWLTPIVSWDRYDAKGGSHDKTDGYTAGLSGGVARQLDIGTVGIGLTYLYSKQQGGHYDAESDNFSIMAGYVSQPVRFFGAFAPQFEAAVGYTYSNIDQERRDTTGKKRSSDPDIHSGRLYLGLSQTIMSDNGALAMTPRFGLDYTHLSLDSASEGANGLKMSGKDIDSLRPRLGADFNYAVTDRFALTASAYARYETLDKNANLDTRFNGTPIVWTTDDEDRDRTSGELGIGFAYQAAKNMTVNGRYDLTVGDNYYSHQASVNLNWQF